MVLSISVALFALRFSHVYLCAKHACCVQQKALGDCTCVYIPFLCLSLYHCSHDFHVKFGMYVFVSRRIWGKRMIFWAELNWIQYKYCVLMCICCVRVSMYDKICGKYQCTRCTYDFLTVSHIKTICKCLHHFFCWASMHCFGDNDFVNQHDFKDVLQTINSSIYKWSCNSCHKNPIIKIKYLRMIQS